MRNSLLLLIAILILSGCAYSPMLPRMTAEEKARMKEESYPAFRQQNFTDALRRLGRFINSRKDGKEIVVMVQPAPNVTGSGQMPVNITMEIEACLDFLAGKKFKVMPYAPRFRYNLTLSPLPSVPHYYIRAGITRFDKDLKREATSRELDLLIGGGKWASGLDFDTDRAMTSSEVSTVFELVNMKSGKSFPQLSQSNTVMVFRLDARNRAGFSIYGNGLEAEGRLTVQQGLHAGIKNLIDYSLLQMFSKLYGYRYWQDGSSGLDDNVVHSLTSEFSGYSQSTQVLRVQRLLRRIYPHGLVNSRTRERIYVPLTGRRDWKTDLFINMFCQERRLNPRLAVNLPELYRHLLPL